MHRLPILAVAFLLCGAGVARVWASDSDWTGALLAGAGLITLGVWVGVEARERDKDK